MSENMPGKEEKQDKKKIRIAGVDFWVMYDPLSQIDEKKEEFQNWLKDKCKDYGMYVDQIENVLTGKYRLDDGTDHKCPNPKCGAMLNTGTVKRLPQEFIDAANEQWKPIEDAAKEANKARISIAKKYGIPPGFIDIQTGEIKNEDMEIAKPVQS